MSQLSRSERELLVAVISVRRPDLLAKALRGSSDLAESERLDIQLALTEELMESGLSEGDEPNSRGYELESLIDQFGPGMGMN